MHDDFVAGRTEDLHIAEPEPAVVVNDQHLVPSAERRPWQDDDVVNGPARDFRFHEHPGGQRRTQGVVARRVRVVHLRDHVYHPAHGVDLAFSPDDTSLPDMLASGKVGRDGDSGTGLPHGASIRQRHVDVGQFLIWQRQPDLGGVDRVDPGDRVALVDELTDVDLLALDTSGVRRRDVRAFEVACGPVQCRFGGRDGRACVLHLRLPQRQTAGVTTTQVLPFPSCDLRLGFFLGEPQFSLGQLRPSRDDRLLVVIGVDAQEHVARFEETAHGERRRDLDHRT